MAAARGLISRPRNWCGSTVCAVISSLKALAELTGKIEDFALQPFQVFAARRKGNCREPHAGSRTFNAQRRLWKRLISWRRGFNVAAFAQRHGGGADVFPLGAERFNDGRQNEAFHIGCVA